MWVNEMYPGVCQDHAFYSEGTPKGSEVLSAQNSVRPCQEVQGVPKLVRGRNSQEHWECWKHRRLLGDNGDDQREWDMMGARSSIKLTYDVLICALDVRLAERIANFTVTDLLVQDAWTAMSQHSSLFPRVSCDDWTFMEGSLYFKGHLYVPEPAHQDLVCSLHCSPVGGHGRYFRTVHLVQRDYWWPGLTTFVQQFVAGCATCQANKVNTHLTVPGLFLCLLPISADLV